MTQHPEENACSAQHSIYDCNVYYSASILSSVCVFACSRYLGLKLFKQHASWTVILQWYEKFWACLWAHLGTFWENVLALRSEELAI